MPEETLNQEDMKKLDLMLYRILTPEARERLNNIRLVNLDRYLQISSFLVNASQQGKFDLPLDDSSLKEILLQSSNSREVNIKRK